MKLLKNKKIIVFLLVLLIIAFTPRLLIILFNEQWSHTRNYVIIGSMDFTPDPAIHYFIETFDFHLLDNEDYHLHIGNAKNTVLISVSGTEGAIINFDLTYMNEGEIITVGQGGFSISTDRLVAAAIPISEPFTEFQLLIISDTEAIGTINIYELIGRW